MSAHPEPPQEADLVRQRREAAVPDLSRRQAAAKAGISPSQWSDVERGHKRAGTGVTVPVRATAETLARMARVVGASAADLAAVGREDAARQLQAFEQQRGLQRRLTAVPGLGALTGPPLPDVGREELLPVIAAGLDAIEHSALPSSAQRELTSMFVDNLIHDARRRHTELILMLRLAAGGTSSDGPVNRSPTAQS
jgi:transcriptional regulator with XRE-family HTH domain